MPPVPQLLGTYAAPACVIGDRVECLFRGLTCVVTSITAAPIPWPWVQPLEQRGGCGLLVNETLERAIRTESASALKYHFRASTTTVWAWRKCFGVGGHLRTPGSRKAQLAVSRLGAGAIKAKEWTDEERDAKVATVRALGLRPPNHWTPERGGWASEEVSLLDTFTDAEIVAKIARRTMARWGRRVPGVHGFRFRSTGRLTTPGPLLPTTRA